MRSASFFSEGKYEDRPAAAEGFKLGVYVFAFLDYYQCTVLVAHGSFLLVSKKMDFTTLL